MEIGIRECIECKVHGTDKKYSALIMVQNILENIVYFEIKKMYENSIISTSYVSFGYGKELYISTIRKTLRIEKNKLIVKHAEIFSLDDFGLADQMLEGELVA